VVKDVEPVVSGAFGPAEHFGQSLEAHRAPVLRGKPGAQIAEDVAGRKRIPRSGHKSVVEKFCFPRLLVHAFWFASKLAAAAFVQASIPLFAKPTRGCPLAQKKRPADWKSLPFDSPSKPDLGTRALDRKNRVNLCQEMERQRTGFRSKFWVALRKGVHDLLSRCFGVGK